MKCILNLIVFYSYTYIMINEIIITTKRLNWILKRKLWSQIITKKKKLFQLH